MAKRKSHTGARSVCVYILVKMADVSTYHTCEVANGKLTTLISSEVCVGCHHGWNYGKLIDDDIEEEEFEVDEQDMNLVHGVTNGVSDPRGTSPPQTGGPTKERISAQFGRWRTHNEQILVAPCGMIIARETFYGAEAIATCAVGRFSRLRV